MTRQPLRHSALVVAAGLGLVTVGCGEDYDPFALGETRHDYVSRPDLGAPDIEVTTFGPEGSRASDDDLIFLAPKDGEPMNSLLIVDAVGEPVWIQPLGEARSYDLKVQAYDGEPVLTWWNGENLALGYGAGEWVIADSSYEEVATVTTQDVQEADFHDLILTDEGTALMVSYPKVERDLSEIGGPTEGYVIDNVIQEVDVETGEVLFEWSALDHIPLTDTRVDVQTAEGQDGLEDTPFDYAHVNSISEDTDGSLLISARNTHAIYRVDRETGEIDWTLGGTSSDFAMTGGAAFAWQHDAQWQPDGTITLYDNENLPPMDDQSRGLRIALDRENRTARVVTEYLPPDSRLAESQGNLQVRDNGNVFIGWGQQPYFSEYTADGRLLMDAVLESGETYRAFRLPWIGEPAAPPDLVVEEGVAYVSWNGATEVAAWRFVAGEDADTASEVATVPRESFETAVEVPAEPYVAVEALDADGQVLGSAEA